MGFGDVKFAIGMGWLLGTAYGLIALIYAFIIGAIVGVFILLPLEKIISASLRIQKGFTPITASQKAARGFTMKSEVPFGPFLIIGTCIIWISVLYSYEPTLTLLGDLVLSSY